MIAAPKAPPRITLSLVGPEPHREVLESALAKARADIRSKDQGRYSFVRVNYGRFR